MKPGRSRVWEDSCEWPQVDAEAGAAEKALSARGEVRRDKEVVDGGCCKD